MAFNHSLCLALSLLVPGGGSQERATRWGSWTMVCFACLFSGCFLRPSLPSPRKRFHPFIALLLFLWTLDSAHIHLKRFSAVDSNYHYPENQAMRIYSSLWNADDWATRGGLVKTDWSKAPFVASFSNFNAATSSSNFAGEEDLDSNKEQKLQWVRNNYMIYDYCADTKRFPQGLPAECK